MIMRNKLFFVGLLILLIFPTGFAKIDGKEEYSERGRYIYDERDFLPLETELTLSNYLWQLDSKTGYEIVIVFPKKKLSEELMIQWFNDHGVGKKDIDNGTAAFVFPDNSVFLAIGSGNDKVSVTIAKTYGEKILKNMDKDPVLSLLRFNNLLSERISEPTTLEWTEKFGRKVMRNLDVIFLWALVVSLIIFLIQQKDGFQTRDLVIPGALLVLTGIFSLLSIGSDAEIFDTYKQYGIITSIDKSTHHWVQTVVISTGKSTTTILVPHTDYINKTTILSYNLKEHKYRFETTDSKRAWERQIGEVEVLVIGVEKENLREVYPVDEYNKEGGKTIGDGVWLNQG